MEVYLSWSTLSIATALLVCGKLWVDEGYYRSKRYPPGPPQTPFLGNYLHMPVGWTGRAYAQVAKMYGDIVYFRVPGRQFIVLNNVEDAINLFEKRGNLYSDRPHMVMAHELANRKDTVLFTQYNDRYKQYKRLVTTVTSPRAVTTQWPLQSAEVHRLLFRLLDSPENFVQHLRLMAIGAIVKVLYGHDVTGEDDSYVQWSKNMSYLTNTSSKPGRWLVDSFPWLAYIPSWFPGAGFKRIAKRWRADLAQFTNEPLAEVKRNLEAGTAVDSFVAKQLEEAGAQLSREREEHIKYAAAGLYAGGGDSPASFVETTILCLTRCPAVQKKAQDELDRVVGKDRLPTMSDAPHLPYIESLIKEVHRIHPVSNLVPHATYTEDTYKGYTIPAGASIVANIWGFSRNATMYPSPETFDPDRFIDDKAMDPRVYTFGLGRRKCPGIALTDSLVFLAISSILTVFNVERAQDELGNEIIPELEFDDGLVSHALPFACRIVPRSNAAAALVLGKEE